MESTPFASFYNLPAINLGLINYSEARKIQNDYVAKRVAGTSEDILLYCEHPPTLTLGKRTTTSELGLTQAAWKARGVEIVEVDRGGGVTLHLPGQVLIYPVVDLRQRRIGVKRFVEDGLRAIAATVEKMGLPAKVSLQPAGVFAAAKAAPQDWYKVAFVGLRLHSGVTNHGFSINVNCDVTPFKLFTPCKDAGLKVSSLLELSA